MKRRIERATNCPRATTQTGPSPQARNDLHFIGQRTQEIARGGAALFVALWLQGAWTSFARQGHGRLHCPPPITAPTLLRTRAVPLRGLVVKSRRKDDCGPCGVPVCKSRRGFRLRGTNGRKPYPLVGLFRTRTVDIVIGTTLKGISGETLWLARRPAIASRCRPPRPAQSASTEKSRTSRAESKA